LSKLPSNIFEIVELNNHPPIKQFNEIENKKYN